MAVLALGVVACEKNDLGDMDSSSINAPIEAKIEVTSADFDVAISRLENLFSKVEPRKNAPQNLTAKFADVLNYTTFTSNSQLYVHLSSEEYTSCFDDYSDADTTIYSWNTNTNEATIEISGVESTYTWSDQVQIDAWNAGFADPSYLLLAVTSAQTYDDTATQPVANTDYIVPTS